MSTCEDSRAEQLYDLKEASKFLGDCFKESVLKNQPVCGTGFLTEIHAIELRIRILEGTHR